MKNENLKENTTSEKSHGSLNNEQNNSVYGDMTKNEQTIERAMLPETPFTIQWMKEKGYSAGIQHVQMTDWYEKESELLEYLNGTSIGKLDWNLLTGVIQTICIITNKMLKEQEGVKNDN